MFPVVLKDVLIDKTTITTYIKEQQWDKVIDNLKPGIESHNEPLDIDPYVWLGLAYRKKDELDQAQAVLENGREKFPEDSRIYFQLAELAMSKKDWSKAVFMWEEAMNLTKNKSARLYIRLGAAYQYLGQFSESEKILEEGLLLYPDNRDLLISLAKVSEAKFDWLQAKERWDNVYQGQVGETDFEVELALSIVNQIIGDSKQSQKHLQTCLENHSKELAKNYKSGYKKVVLFNNNETRIEFYKKLSICEDVVITFDSRHMHWAEQPFGYRFLTKYDVDIIAVRKRNANLVHQDLTIEEFENVVKVIVGNYKKRIAYGFSLGAYSVLYYCLNLQCEMLSLSPRNRFHPIFGTDNKKGTIEFHHNLFYSYNEKLSPIIVYDPKNNYDKRYIETELKVKFPNARLLKTPYSGHETANYLLEVGALKDLVTKVLTGQEVSLNYDRDKRKFSFHYLMTITEICLERNKNKWALKISQEAEGIAPKATKGDKLSPKAAKVRRMRIQALWRLGETQQAHTLAEDTLKNVPKKKQIEVYLLLIDLHMMDKNLLEANEIVKSISHLYEDSNRFLDKKKQIADLLLMSSYAD